MEGAYILVPLFGKAQPCMPSSVIYVTFSWIAHREEKNVGFEDHVLLDHLLKEFPVKGRVYHHLDTLNKVT